MIERVRRPENSRQAIDARIDGQLRHIDPTTPTYGLVNKVYRPFVQAWAQMERDGADPKEAAQATIVLIANMMDEVSRTVNLPTDVMMGAIMDIIENAEKVR